MIGSLLVNKILVGLHGCTMMEPTTYWTQKLLKYKILKNGGVVHPTSNLLMLLRKHDPPSGGFKIYFINKRHSGQLYGSRRGFSSNILLINRHPGHHRLPWTINCWPTTFLITAPISKLDRKAIGACYCSLRKHQASGGGCLAIIYEQTKIILWSGASNISAHKCYWRNMRLQVGVF